MAGYRCVQLSESRFRKNRLERCMNFWKKNHLIKKRFHHIITVSSHTKNLIWFLLSCNSDFISMRIYSKAFNKHFCFSNYVLCNVHLLYGFDPSYIHTYMYGLSIHDKYTLKHKIHVNRIKNTMYDFTLSSFFYR